MEFIYTTIPQKEYKEQENLGRYTVIHFDPVDCTSSAENDNGTIPLYKVAEIMVKTSELDIDKVREEYKKWLERLQKTELKNVQLEKEDEIKKYDTSDAINEFTIVQGNNSYNYWLSATKRNQLVTAITSWAKSNKDYVFDLREYNSSLTIPCEIFLSVLSQLEDYAVKCYNVTSKHISDIYALTDIDAVKSFDVTADYPEKLTFTLE